jgi:hypothetical protein
VRTPRSDSHRATPPSTRAVVAGEPLAWDLRLKFVDLAVRIETLALLDVPV